MTTTQRPGNSVETYRQWVARDLELRRESALARADFLDEKGAAMNREDRFDAAYESWGRYIDGYRSGETDVTADQRAEQARVFARFARFLPEHKAVSLAEQAWGSHDTDAEPAPELIAQLFGIPVRLLTVHHTRSYSCNADANLSAIERRLITPPHVARTGMLDLADYLFAKGHRDRELSAMLPRFRWRVVAELKRRGIEPLWVPAGAGRIYVFRMQWKPVVDSVYAEHVEAVLATIPRNPARAA